MKKGRSLCTYHIDKNKNERILHFSTFKNKYIEVCRRSTGGLPRRLEFKCPLNQNVHFGSLENTFSAHIGVLRSVEVKIKYRCATLIHSSTALV
jgi:hypothetical protein